MHAFDVEPENVRFVATSATIASEEPRAVEDRLRSFLADVAGVDATRVDVVTGSRLVPDLPGRADSALTTGVDVRQLAPEDLFNHLIADPGVIALREHLVARPGTLRELTATRVENNGASPTAKQCMETLDLLDLASRARRGDIPLLPIRGHFFHRTQVGLWACVNSGCAGRQDTPLEDAEWPFGAVYLERRDHCHSCSSPCYELVLCGECGAEYLAAEEVLHEGSRFLRARTFARQEDEFDDGLEPLQEEPNAEAEDEPIGGLIRLIAARDSDAAVGTVVDPGSLRIVDDATAGLSVGLVLPDPTEGALRCVRCGELERGNRPVFRPARIGAPFLLGVAIPTLLESTPRGEGEVNRGPFDGRRVLTFSDSRQGTARFAVKAQGEAERNHIRSVLYHAVGAARATDEDSAEREQNRQRLQELEQVPNRGPALENMVRELRDRLASGDQPLEGRLSWREAADRLRNDHAVREWMATAWEDLALGDVRQAELPQFCLLREFFRRPRRQFSLETLGLVALDYPKLRDINERHLPVPARRIGLSAEDWRAFLKLCLDYVIRGTSAVSIPPGFLRWLGAPVRTTYFQGPDFDNPAGVTRRPRP